MLRSDSVIMISWIKPQDVDIKHINIYRRIGGEQNFTKIKTLPGNISLFSDSAVTYHIKHRYYVTFGGGQGESPPTRTISTIPGPLSIWILDYYDLYVLKYTYDLSFTPFQYYALWYQQSMALSFKSGIGLITYPIYHYFEIFSLKSGNFLTGNDRLEYPYDCLYSAARNTFLVSDSSSGIYEVSISTGQERLLTATAGKPTQLQYTNTAFVYALYPESRSIKKFTSAGLFTDEIKGYRDNHFAKPVYFHVDERNNTIYIIDRWQNADALLRINPELQQCDTLIIHESIKKVLINTNTNDIWISVNTPGDEDACLLQLSYDGLRLNEINGFSYIADFVINPYNNALIVCDYYGYKVVQIRPDGSVISETKGKIVPYKVYVQ
ncbi:MAG: hypothetical protein JXR46_03350 [Calditrichaceae bacterium]|nr:hypothetical protein [Calditrichaceae bacterium]MBN2708059.1 hypothetical protein [Calditrichaceae bacterium]RQV92300.1 MAG: hypothetical protein EH224_15955 [Calditrichota bacterium]